MKSTKSHSILLSSGLRISVGLAAMLGMAGPLHAALRTTPTWTAEGNQASAFFSSSIATAGDVNGDSYSDVIVGAVGYNAGQTDEGRAFVYLGSASGPSASPDWTAEGDQAGARFGASVACAGDVNGDGYDDVIIGADSYDNGQTDEGRAFLYLGSPGGLGSSPAWTAEINDDGANFGVSVGTAGDVNGDGYDDVIIGALNYTHDQNMEGGAWVYLGTSSGLAASPIWHYEGNSVGSTFGYSVGTAGDVNGDGYADVIVGAYLLGRAFVFHGTNTGVNPTPNWIENGDAGAGGFGQCVSTAGDVNGDGYADVIVSAPFYANGQSTEGKCYVYYGSGSGLSTTPAWTEESNSPTAAFGWFVATAGDVNGDGYADVIIGAKGYDGGQTDEGRAYVYQGSVTGLANSPVWAAEGNLDDAQFGSCVASGGDADGDGFGDVLVGAPYYTDPDVREGKAYLYTGLAGDLHLVADWTDEIDQAGAAFGTTVNTAGDVNGDGYSDAIVGAFLYSNGQSSEGRASVYYGSSSGLPSSPSWNSEGNQTSALYGFAVGTAGDVNGDGYGDVVIGSAIYDNTVPNEGQAFVFLGSANGLGASPAWTYHGGQDGAWFAWAAASAGDVNGDGYGDLIVGAPNYDGRQVDEGRLYLFLGSANGLGSDPSWTYEGLQEGGNLGFAVSAADVNGDGYSDLIASAPDYTNGQSEEGRAYMFLGGPDGPAPSPDWTAESDQAYSNYGVDISTAGDVNGDGYGDVIVGASGFDISLPEEGKAYVYLGSSGGLNPTPAWTRYGLQDGARLGEAVGCAGDVNGDGFSDIVIGSPYYDNGSTDEGRAYLFLGTVAGPATSPAWTGEANQADARYGSALNGAGDVDGDGFSDLLIGAPDYSNGQSGEGRAFLYYGNEGDGIDRVPRQRRTDETAPIDLLGKSDSETAFRVYVRGRTPAGRGLVRLLYEVKPLGTPFDGTGLGAGSFVDTGSPDPQTGSYAQLRQQPGGLTPDMPYHWRLRVDTTSPFFPHSAWLSHPGNNRTETDLRTGGSSSAVPEVAEVPGGGVMRLTATSPFRDRTEIRFMLPKAGPIHLGVYDAQGRVVARLEEGLAEAGAHARIWDGRDGGGRAVSSGVYFVRLEAAGTAETRKVVARR